MLFNLLLLLKLVDVSPYLVVSSSKVGDIGFDPVVFAPAFISRSVHYGFFILLGDDPAAAKFLGPDQDYTFNPDFLDRQNEIAAHSIAGESYSYVTRVQALLNTGLNTSSFPVSTDGFTNGVPCDRAYHELCASDFCALDYLCGLKVDELCVPETCFKDEDCASGTCIYESCASGTGQVEVDCPCRFDSNCQSGECDQSITSLDWTCYNVTDGAVRTTIISTGAMATTFLGGLLGLLW